MNFKKVSSFVTALLLTAAIAIPSTAFAATVSQTTDSATSGAITLTGETVGSHYYTAYQIFTYSYSEDGTINVDTISYAGYDLSAFVTALKNNTTLADLFEESEEGVEYTVADVATVLAEIGEDDSEAAQALATICAELGLTATVSSSNSDNVNTISLEATGYYVIVETAFANTDSSLTANGARTRYILTDYNAETGLVITVKSSEATFEKKIMDTDDSDADSDSNDKWVDTADYDIGDSVPFLLRANLPDNYSEYYRYKLVFHDTVLENGFTLNENSIVVFIDGNADGLYTADDTSGDVVLSTSDYSISYGESDTDCSFEVTITDLKTSSVADYVTDGASICVYYTAVLNEECVIGANGNWNTAYLQYSSNPNYNGEGTGGTDSSSTDNQGGGDSSTGDDDGTGTGGDSGSGDGSGTEDSANDTPDSETSNTVEDKVGAFTYQVVVSKTDVDNNALAGATFALYKYDSSIADYVQVGEDLTASNVYDEEDETVLASSTFSFVGIDAGMYKLVEVSAPSGYSAIDDIYFTVTAEHQQELDSYSGTDYLTSLAATVTDANGDVATEDGDGETGSTVTFTCDTTNGSIATTIVNAKSLGITLPITGGAGTVAFYVVGGALVAFAGVTLITRKRVEDEEK